jgi:urea transport system permease protein
MALLIGWLVCPAAAQQPPPPAAAVAAPPTSAPADEKKLESQIRQILPQLAETNTGPAAVEELVALREAQVLTVFQRLIDRTVYTIDGKLVFIPDDFKKDDKGVETARVYDLFAAGSESGTITADPIRTVTKEEMSGKDFSMPRPVRTQINNALRVLGLKVNDDAIRRTAARDLGNRRQADALPDLREAASNDPSSKVRHDATESVHLIIASGSDPSSKPEDRIASVARLGELNSLRALDMLKEQAAKPDLSPADKAVYEMAISRIEWHKSITSWVQNLFSGLSAGSIYVLLALGLAITFGLMGVINMAHGEMMMIGAITTWACFEFISPHLPAAYFDWYYVIAFPASFITAAIVGLIIEITIVRHLYKRPLDSMLATIGVSYILIQAVRLWKGDNLGMRGPDWANGNWEIFQDVVLPNNRLFLIVLTIFCILSVVVIFRYTRIGLLIRATVQNREMAQALGVNTRLVDMFTFAFGAGLAGLAGYGIVLTSNPTPEMGQTFIVKSFLTVVVGGVGKLAGVVISGLGLGFIEKLLEPLSLIEKPIHIFDATWAQVAALVVVVLFMQRKPGGLFPEKGRMADQAERTAAPIMARLTRKADMLLGLSFVIFGLGLVPALYGSGAMSPEFVNKLGYITAFAICAIGLDLVWGYIGVLSLCQFLFFSLGGYCMGLYLINYGPMDGARGDIPRALYVVMSDVSGATPPWFLSLFKSFINAAFLGILLPGVLAGLIGFTTFRSRVRGVYFAILTQAITVAFWLIFQKNELKLGGTNGLTNFTHILGFPIAGNPQVGPFAQTRFWLYIASFVTLLVLIFIAKTLTNSGFGRVLVAVRDDETRLRFVGYQTWGYKAAAFIIAAVFAGIGGMLYVPQKGIITPHQMAAGASILVVAWVAVGGRGSLWGSVIGAFVVSLLYETMTSWKPDYWLFVLGGLFVLVPLLLPGGLISLPVVLSRKRGSRKIQRDFDVIPATSAAEGNAS